MEERIISQEPHIFEYVFDESAPSSAPEKEGARQRFLTHEDFARIYHREPLFEINGVKYPIILLSGPTDLDTQRVRINPSRYQISKGLERFRQGILPYTIKPHHFDGRAVRVSDLSNDGKDIELQEVGFFDHKATDMSKDVYIAQFDDSYHEKTTLRDLEVVDGHRKRLKESGLANMLCFSFVITSKRDKDYFIVGQRKNPFEGASSGLLGGTSEWEPLERLSWPDYIRHMSREELKQELCLSYDEFSLGKVTWFQNLRQSIGLIIPVTTSVSSKELAERCSKGQEAKKEHSSFIEVVSEEQTFEVLERKGYTLNNPSKVSLYNYLRAGDEK